MKKETTAKFVLDVTQYEEGGVEVVIFVNGSRNGYQITTQMCSSMNTCDF